MWKPSDKSQVGPSTAREKREGPQWPCKPDGILLSRPKPVSFWGFLEPAGRRDSTRLSLPTVSGYTSSSLLLAPPTPPPLLLWPLRPSLHYHRGLLPHIFCSQRPSLLPGVPARPAGSMASSLCQGPIPWFPTASRIMSLPWPPKPCMVSLPPMSTTTSHPLPSTTAFQPCCLSMLLSALGNASWPPVTLTAAP